MIVKRIGRNISGAVVCSLVLAGFLSRFGFAATEQTEQDQINRFFPFFACGDTGLEWLGVPVIFQTEIEVLNPTDGEIRLQLLFHVTAGDVFKLQFGNLSVSRSGNEAAIDLLVSPLSGVVIRATPTSDYITGWIRVTGSKAVRPQLTLSTAAPGPANVPGTVRPKLDSIALRAEIADRRISISVQDDTLVGTGVSIVNPSPVDRAAGTATFVKEGMRQATVPLEIAPSGSVLGTLAELFASVALGPSVLDPNRRNVILLEFDQPVTAAGINFSKAGRGQLFPGISLIGTAILPD